MLTGRQTVCGKFNENNRVSLFPPHSSCEGQVVKSLLPQHVHLDSAVCAIPAHHIATYPVSGLDAGIGCRRRVERREGKKPGLADLVAVAGLIGSKAMTPPYSTVTDFARLRGWSTSVPLAVAV
jgi:hypothetical protein